MPLTRRGRKAAVADIPIQFKPFRTDLVTIDSLAKAGGEDRPAIVRMLVSEAIKNRNLKAVGKDETLDDVIVAQKKAMAEVLAPIAEKINSLSKDVGRVEGRIADEFSQAEKRQNFLVLCARFIVFQIIICRLLLRDYVHTAYVKFLESVNKPVKDVESNFNQRVEKYKTEAEAILDDLMASTVADLQHLADNSQGFREE